MTSIRERQELKKWGGELISFSPTPGMKFGLSDVHVRQARIQAHVETSDGGSRVTATRAVAIGVFALGAKKKNSDAVTLVLKGDAYVKVVECGKGPKARENAEVFADRINRLTAESPSVRTAEVAVERPTADGENPLGLIKQLSELRDAGALTPEEFEAKKAELLRRL